MHCKNYLAFFMLAPCFLLGGCGMGNQNVDKSVDMTSREINLDNTSELEMLDTARSAVVGISVDLPGGYAIGSGVAIKNGNYILTNNHVVEGGTNPTLYFADKSTGSAKVLWQDAGLDLAILKSSREIPYLRAGSSKNLRIGETVFAFGTPLTLQFRHTVTKGIVSALNRTLEVEGENGSNFLQSLVQHDASINPGNSGGPLINANGEVVGINTLKASEGEGIGFANPIEVGSAILDRIIADNNYKVPYLGVFGFDSEIAQVYGQALGQDGVIVIDAVGPAKTAGVQKNDIIVSLGEYNIKSMQDLRVGLFKFNVGDNVQIGVIRNGQKQFLNVDLSQK